MQAWLASGFAQTRGVERLLFRELRLVSLSFLSNLSGDKSRLLERCLVIPTSCETRTILYSEFSDRSRFVNERFSWRHMVWDSQREF